MRPSGKGRGPRRGNLLRVTNVADARAEPKVVALTVQEPKLHATGRLCPTNQQNSSASVMLTFLSNETSSFGHCFDT